MADKNYLSIYEPTMIGNWKLPEDVKPLDYNDILKISNGWDVIIYDSYIEGGTEDCIDVMRYAKNIKILNSTLKPNGKYGMTIKGGSADVYIKDCVFETHGKEVDIDLGGFAKINRKEIKEKTVRVTLENVTSKDGRPVTVRVLNADKPVVIGGNVKVKVYPKFLVKIIMFFLSLFS